MRKQIESAKQFVADHKNVIIALAIVIPTSVAIVQHAGLKSHDNFLRENNLYDEYYAMNEE